MFGTKSIVNTLSIAVFNRGQYLSEKGKKWYTSPVKYFHPPKIFLKLSLGVVLLVISGCAIQERLYYAAPTLIPNTRMQMKTPGFWISRHPFPDRVILSSREIKMLNAHIADELKLTSDVTKIGPVYSGKELIGELEESLDFLRQEKLYQRNGRRADRKFYRRIEEMTSPGAIKGESKVGYGLIIRYTDQKILPTQEGLYAKSGDFDFDELQNSSLDVGTPLVILHTSLDGRWFYVIGPSSRGWVKAENVALCNQEELSDYLNRGNFVVVTNSKADIFLNPLLTEYYDYTRMGMRFPAVKKQGDTASVEVIIPDRLPDGGLSKRAAYIKREDVSFGYLPYTPRIIMEQGFKLLNAPYGWGGMYGEQDCSAFLQEIFATVGISLPRNSAAQAKVGVLVKEFDQGSSEEEKMAVLSREAVGGVTTLYLKGHIMLFLGMSDGRPYALHAAWAYRQQSWFEKDYVRLINRVAVTDLSLSKGSQRGSLLERLLTVRKVDKI